jgi:hypothetical protein
LTISSRAFSPALNVQSSKISLGATAAREVDDYGNNIAVKNLLSQVESSQLLSQVAKAGLLSKAQKSGVSLTKLEPLIKLAASNKDVMILIEAAAPEALPILPTIIDLAPSALPLLASAIEIPPAALQIAALASVAAAAAGVYFIPDDSVIGVATQTLLVGLLGVVAPAASLIGATVLSKVKGL